MTDTPAPPEPAPLAPPIDHDLPCVICGHNLKGLALDAQCPGCAREVARSYTPPLVQSDPAWLRRQARTMFPLAAVGLMHFHPFYDRISAFMMFPMTTLAALVAAWAVWRLTTPDPLSPTADRDATLRRALRLAILVYVGIRIAWFMNLAVTGRAAAGTGFASLGCVIAAAVMVAYVLLILARRAGDPSLVRHARFVLWAFPISQAAERLSLLMTVLLARYNPEAVWVFNISSVLQFVLGAAVFALILLLGRLHEVFRAAATVAETTTAAAPTVSAPT